MLLFAEQYQLVSGSVGKVASTAQYIRHPSATLLEIETLVNRYGQLNYDRFVNWTLPCVVTSVLKSQDISACMLSTTSKTGDYFNQMQLYFGQLFQKRAFVHAFDVENRAFQYAWEALTEIVSVYDFMQEEDQD